VVHDTGRNPGAVPLRLWSSRGDSGLRVHQRPRQALCALRLRPKTPPALARLQGLVPAFGGCVFRSRVSHRGNLPEWGNKSPRR
jgi:hypothetical protein